MLRRPRPFNEPIIPRPMMARLFVGGLFMAGAALILVEIGKTTYGSLQVGQSMALVGLSLMNIFLALNLRFPEDSAFGRATFANPRFLQAIAWVVIASILITSAGVLQNIFGTTSLTGGAVGHLPGARRGPADPRRAVQGHPAGAAPEGRGRGRRRNSGGGGRLSEGPRLRRRQGDDVTQQTTAAGRQVADATATTAPVAGRGPDRDYTPAMYGSLLVTTLIAVQWRSEPSITFVGLSVLISILVFWLAHVWSGVVNRRLHGPIGRADLVEIGGGEAPMLAAAVLPVLVLGVAWILDTPVDRAIELALVASVAQLFVWGLAVGRAAHEGWLLALVVAAVDCALGFVVVALKVLVIH